MMVRLMKSQAAVSGCPNANRRDAGPGHQLGFQRRPGRVPLAAAAQNLRKLAKLIPMPTAILMEPAHLIPVETFEEIWSSQ